MTARSCFDAKAKKGLVSARSAAEIDKMLEEFELRYAETMGPAGAARQAATDAAARLENLALERALDVQSAALAAARMTKAVEVYATDTVELRKGKAAPLWLRGENVSTAGSALNGMLARDPNEIAKTGNVSELWEGLRRRAHRIMAETFENLRAKRLGFKAEIAKETDLLRAAKGETAGDAARVGWEAFRETRKYLIDQLKRAGARLPARPEAFPNFPFDPVKVRTTPLETFLADVTRAADREAMIDPATGLPYTAAEFDRLVRDAYAAETADFPADRAEALRLMELRQKGMRMFEWKDADSWMDVGQRYGTHASPLRAILEDIDDMSQEVAFHTYFGRSKEAAYRFGRKLIEDEGRRMAQTYDQIDEPTRRLFGVLPARSRAEEALKLNKKVAAQVNRARWRFDNLFDELSGAVRVPVSAELAKRGAEVRAWLTASQLGSAIVASISDPFLALMTARANRLPVMGVVRETIRMMRTPGNEVLAAQNEMNMDSLIYALGGNSHYMGEAITTGTIMKLPGAVIRLQGLRKWTQLWRQGFHNDATGHVAREAGKTFAELDPEFRAVLEKYTIDSRDWDIIRHTEAYEPRPNARYIRPSDVDDGTPAAFRAFEKYSRWVSTELRHAVIDKDPYTRALMNFGVRPGTLLGEGLKSGTMYKSYPSIFMTTHLARAFNRGWNGKKMGTLAATFIGLTLLATIRNAATDVLNGKDPGTLDPTTEAGRAMWARAVFQGGGLGLFSEFFTADRLGNGWAAALTGPVIDLGESVLNDWLLGNITKAVNGDETHFLGDALYILGRNLPGGTLPVVKTLFNREILDQLHLMIDGRARERFAGMEGNARRSYGQGYWFRPGQQAPSRAPDLTAIGGGR